MKAKRPRPSLLSVTMEEDFILSAELAFKTRLTTNGIAKFSELIPMPPSAESIMKLGNDYTAEALRLALRWEGLTELGADHGLSICFSILNDAGLIAITRKHQNRLLSDIQGKLNNSAWLKFSEHLLSIDNSEEIEGGGSVFIVAAWAELFSEPFGEVWLAAMAGHAYSVKGNDFAFGYMTSLLDQKQSNEEHFLRGSTILKGSKEGGAARRRNLSPITQKVLDEMVRLISSGHTAKGAAEVTARRKIGTSTVANLALWNRRKKKL